MSGQILRFVSSLVLDGLRETSAAGLIAAADLSWHDRAGGAGVPLGPYRAVLERVRQEAGGRCLLEAGRALAGRSHPILFVLLNSATPADLLQKERRLARFIHSRHRVQLLEESDTNLLLEHRSSSNPPSNAESLAACGQYLVLLEEIGCRGLRCRLPLTSSPRRWVYRAGEYRDVAKSGDCSRWEFAWDSFEPTRQPMQGLDELLLRGSSDELEEVSEVVEPVLAVVRADLGRCWRLPEVAAQLGLAARTLQRRLRSAGTTFRGVLLEARLQAAARLLRDGTLSVTEVGYVCGFSDTAHMTRTFKGRFEATPTSYRQAHA